MIDPFLTLRRASTHAAVAACLSTVASAAHSQQALDLELRAAGTFTRAVFSFGPLPPVDLVSPAQTGLASTSVFAVTPGIGSLVDANPWITARLVWDAGDVVPVFASPVLAGYLGGSSLTVTLPSGTGSGPLHLSNQDTGLAFSGVADNALAVSSTDVLFVPGTVDMVTAGLDGNFSGAGLRFGGTATTPTAVDLLADPMFRASYNGIGSLESLQELVVRITPAPTRTLVAADLSLVDFDGDAVSGLTPPPELDLGAFDPVQLSIRFSGAASASLNRSDYASQASFDAARAFWLTSGLQSIGIEQYAGWSAVPVPEPGTWGLFMAGLAGMALLRRQRRAIAAAVVCSAATAAQAADYRIVDLSIPGMQVLQVWDVNNLGQVAGSAWNGSRQVGFVWQDGQVSLYDGPQGATAVSAFGLSDLGHVAGTYWVESPSDGGVSQQYGWLFDEHGYATITAPDGEATEVRGISPDGRWLSLSTGRLFDRLTGQWIDALPQDGSLLVIAQGINGLGQHVGSIGSGAGRIGYLFDLGTGSLMEATWPGLRSSSFRDINNLGVVAGWAQGTLPGLGTATTIGVIGTPAAATSFVVPGSTSTTLQGINDAGWVSGLYRLPGGDIDTGFVAIPIPEPGTWALLALGLVAIDRLARRHPARSA